MRRLLGLARLYGSLESAASLCRVRASPEQVSAALEEARRRLQELKQLLAEHGEEVRRLLEHLEAGIVKAIELVKAGRLDEALQVLETLKAVVEKLLQVVAVLVSRSVATA